MTYSLTRRQLIIPEIGVITIVKTRINRRISIRVTPRHVRVSIPYRVSFDTGEDFLLKNIEWVRNKYNQLRYQFKFYDQQVIKTLFGNIHINIKQGSLGKFRVIRENDRISVYMSGEVDSSDLQHKMRQRMIQLIRKEGLIYLSKRTEELSKRHGLRFQRIQISSALTRWGSCSSANVISLNYRLVFLPQELCDYVILHELAHTVHKNHSKAYWSYLYSLEPDFAIRKQELKKYNFSTML